MNKEALISYKEIRDNVKYLVSNLTGGIIDEFETIIENIYDTKFSDMRKRLTFNEINNLDKYDDETDGRRKIIDMESMYIRRGIATCINKALDEMEEFGIKPSVSMLTFINIILKNMGHLNLWMIDYDIDEMLIKMLQGSGMSYKEYVRRGDEV